VKVTSTKINALFIARPWFGIYKLQNRVVLFFGHRQISIWYRHA
jgi:hypothetical protein